MSSITELNANKLRKAYDILEKAREKEGVGILARHLQGVGLDAGWDDKREEVFWDLVREVRATHEQKEVAAGIEVGMHSLRHYLITIKDQRIVSIIKSEDIGAQYDPNNKPTPPSSLNPLLEDPYSVNPDFPKPGQFYQLKEYDGFICVVFNKGRARVDWQGMSQQMFRIACEFFLEALIRQNLEAFPVILHQHIDLIVENLRAEKKGLEEVSELKKTVN